jgi:hypothetical protein
MAFAALAVVLWRLAGLNLMLKATTGLANVSGTEFDWTVGEAGDFKCLKGSISSPVLERAGFFLLAPSRGLLPAFNFWTRAGMCRVPGRRRIGFGLIGCLAGPYPAFA